ncbi:MULTISPECIES: DUF4124 domain-containing protein [Marinobacter]|uniref:DUF4124 domain-containing protein n=1 Tax=Marinobacter TaxID=2742 RepID=UPI0009491D1F|nr:MULTISPECIES: DUF4124 domain-containing protein [Marinobacter]OLF85739.1 hypothetical protein AWH63_01880 [Marinobacter sp. C18]|tara:strand:- start:11452 stop:11901 length:450 start_codon:yes stop_codon:yes gene_type:complete
MPWRQAAVFVLLVIPAISSAQKMYTWIDDQGVAHFTDIKPIAREHEHVELKRPSLIPMRENITRGKRVSTINQQVNRSLEGSSSGQRTLTDKQEARERERKNARCEGYREKLDRIQKQLRAGYSNDQGNRLRRQRREVSQKLSRECLLG